MKSQTISNMIEALETARECLSTLASHTAFEGDAVEFNQGGIGYEACTALRNILDEVATDSDERSYAEIAEDAVYDSVFVDAKAAARTAIKSIGPSMYRDALVSSVAMLTADRLMDRMREAALAAAADVTDEIKS